MKIVFLECFRNAVQSLGIQSNSYIHQSISLSKGSHSISFYFIVLNLAGVQIHWFYHLMMFKLISQIMYMQNLDLFLINVYDNQ